MTDKKWYTMEETASKLGVTGDELKDMARKGKIRPYQAGKTWQFKSQDVEGLVGYKPGGSEAEFDVSEAPTVRPGAPATMLASKSAMEEEVRFDDPAPGQSKPGSGARRIPAADDSDVRLLVDSSSEMDVPAAISGKSKPPAPKTQARPKAGAANLDQSDSGVRLVPSEGEHDSDVKIVPDLPSAGKSAYAESPPRSASDSDIKLEPSPGRVERDIILTEEIDLDAELRKPQAVPAAKQKPKAKPKTPPPKPAITPFDLSEDDLEVPKFLVDSSTDQVPVPPGLQSADDEVDLGELEPGSGVSSSKHSGINLEQPADSGISLEKKEEEATAEVDSSDFDLNVEPAEIEPDSSDFELSVEHPVAADDKTSSSDFDLNIDEAAAKSDSSSEFELTLDDAGGLSAVQSGDAKGDAEADIFETDFEMPALEEDSAVGKGAAEGDTELESSDFDLSLDDSAASVVDVSASQVVDLGDSADIDEVAKPVGKKKKPAKSRTKTALVDDSAETDDVLAEDEDAEAFDDLEEEGELEPVAAGAAAPESWGVLPAALLIPCVFLMFLVGMMSFELLHSMWGYHQPYAPSGVIVGPLSDLFGGESGKK